MNESILVTGGAGYIGSVLVPQLLNLGYKVTVYDNFIYNQNSLLDVCNNKNLKIIVSDVRNETTFKKIISEHDIIIPLAAIVGAPACKKDSTMTIKINQTQLENLSKWLSSSQRIIYPVTNSGYGIGEMDKMCTEESPLKPISLYGKTKVAGEKVLLENGNAVTLRLATVFGSSPRMRVDLLVNDFVYRALKDRFIVLFESHFKRNYIHIRDIVSVFVHAINNYEKMKGNAFNVGLSNANLSKMELCLKIKEHLNDFYIFESDLAEDPDKRNYIVSNEKIEKTGWLPNLSIDDGITELIKVYSFLKIYKFSNL